MRIPYLRRHDSVLKLHEITPSRPCYRRVNRAMPLYISTSMKFYNHQFIISQYWTVYKHNLCTLNMATLSTRTHLAPEPWITFRGHSRSHILGSLKSRRGTAYYCVIMWSLESEMSKERSEHIRFLELRCHSAPLSRKPCEYLHKCYTLETTFIRLHFHRWLCECVRLSSFVFLWRARK